MNELEEVEFTEIVGVGKYMPSISISSLSSEEKRQLWTHLKAYHPDVAAYLTIASGDGGFCKLMSEFDEDLMLSEDYFPADLKRKHQSKLLPL